MIRLKKDGTPAKKPGRKPDPNKVKKVGPGRNGPRPHVWRVGPDEFKHSMYHPWQMSKAQAVFRNEVWNLTFEEYHDIWADKWKERGRGKDDYCQSRKDPNGPWDKDNMIIITRREHLDNQRTNRANGIFKAGTTRPGRPSRSSIDKPIQYIKVKK